jgi:hypothetical protein
MVMTGIGPDLAGIATVVRVLAARPELRAVFPPDPEAPMPDVEKDAPTPTAAITMRPERWARLLICGETVIVKYDPNLADENGQPRRGMTAWEATPLRDAEHGRPYRQVIWLREWDERVFLHELLHVLLGKHYPNGRHAYDHSFIEDPQHERAVRTIEDALWDMGWRLLDGYSTVDPLALDRNASTRVTSPDEQATS